MNKQAVVTIDGRQVVIENEQNLLELIRKADIDLVTFCYHSELSVYGACRLCFVEVEGRGIQPACSTAPAAGMKIRTHTEELREMRRVTLELLLANHDQSCPTCARSTSCQLQKLARRLGIEKVRYKRTHQQKPVDRSSWSLVRDPNKCVLCGDCVRMCSEIQTVGAIDFAMRGANVSVQPSFGKDLAEVECVYCGQCSSVCPTGALTPKSEIPEVWKEIDNPEKTVIVQIAPAVRVALGEEFGMEPGSNTMGLIVSALKAIGFDRVYDTSFAADLTVVEESHEFLNRFLNRDRIPQFTSCCPGWVKFAEQYYPELLQNISTCKSPQQMFGALAKTYIAQSLGVARENLTVVSIMPCTAKKFEARREEFQRDGIPDVDYVLTTQELARMIEESGISFRNLHPESFDLPFGFHTGAGVIFGNSGGVSEAVLRFLSEKVTGKKSDAYIHHEVRGQDGIRETTVQLNGHTVKIAVVHGLGNARRLIDQIQSGEQHFDFVEVMACPNGCVGGAGQPICTSQQTKASRTHGLYENDVTLALHKSQENPFIHELYRNHLGEVGGETAHHLLHTSYLSRKRISEEGMALIHSSPSEQLEVSVCVGTGCFLNGSMNVLQSVLDYVQKEELMEHVQVKASFCFERCDRGPTVMIGDEVHEKCSGEKACFLIEQKLPAAKRV
ncbi:MAG: NADH-dependent [FeFe] hydrogenase, group A6 [bacterium]